MSNIPVQDIRVDELTNTRHVQKAQVFLPLKLFDGITVEAYRAAIAVVQKVREAALGVLDVTEENADVTGVDYKLDDVGHAVVTVTQVNV